ncbi:MAG TPA: hypothetical protein VEC37_09900 [Bacillota bacterium]|nr:hypothetical protein [Bacillota bacterium]
MKKINLTFLQTLKACWSIFRIKTAEGFQYRLAGLAGFSTSVFWALIEITIYIVFYRYADNQDAGSIAGIGLKQIVSYAWLAQLLFLMQPLNIDSEILSKITSGDIGIELCRPLDLYSHWFAKTAAARLTPLFWRGSLVLCCSMLMPSPYRIGPPASLPGLTYMLLSMMSALLLCTAFAMLVSALRLNIAWGDGPTYMALLIGNVLSGAYLPLQLWPETLQGFLLMQPFAGYLDIPLRLYIGTMSVGDALPAIGLQFFWIVVFVSCGKLLISLRLKRIIVQGG